MLSSEIRTRYLEFFSERDHTLVSSDLLVPREDPTLLFTGAGMNQFKEQFMGRNITFRRAASCQKCLRTGDLENVGRTPRHHTFFEMLGNFSFGDYFKKEAISWGWEFMVDRMKVPADKLWISVYEDDAESYSIWRDVVKVPEERIVKLGMDTNFWPANAPAEGPNGPCGPCSEIFFDRGESAGCGKKGCDPSCDCGRFVEVWNLVFTEFDRKPDGTLEALPSKNIDTGMGLERMAAVMQGVATNFQTDLFVPITDKVKAELAEAEQPLSESDLNLVADHLRAAVFAITDGVSPSNEKRGYVVRKLIRRAWLKGSFRDEPFLYNIVPTVAKIMGEVYPEVAEKREHVSAIIEEEERRFSDTLRSAIPVCESMLAGGSCRLGGAEIFKLVDTYGLPVDVIKEIAGPRGVELDIKGFESYMEKRREESRKGSDLSSDFIFQPDLFEGAPRPGFSHDHPLEAEIAFILKGEKEEKEVLEGEQAEIIVSPQSGELYTEGGGQVGDTGTIAGQGGLLKILNTYDADGRKVMVVYAEKGRFKKGDRVTLDIDRDRKKRTAMNHTATHLLQAALREVLGDHVKQSGSLVDDSHLRFDFTHMKKLAPRELRKVEDTVNAWIKDGIPVCKETKSFKEAKEQGALSFFGEKYSDTVRVVAAGDVSMELCGGTHVDNTAEVDIVKITAESSVASGIRRIEALTGDAARAWLREKARGLLEEYDKYVKASPVHGDVLKEVKGLDKALAFCRGILEDKQRPGLEDMHEFEDTAVPAVEAAREAAGKLEKKMKKAEAQDAFTAVRDGLDEALGKAAKDGGAVKVFRVFEDADMAVLRKALAYAEKRISSGVVFLGGSRDGKAALVCSVTGDLAAKGMSAKDIIEAVSPFIEGRGGGSDTFAQAGGKNPAGLDEAVKEAEGALKKKGI